MMKTFVKYVATFHDRKNHETITKIIWSKEMNEIKSFYPDYHVTAAHPYVPETDFVKKWPLLDMQKVSKEYDWSLTDIDEAYTGDWEFIPKNSKKVEFVWNYVPSRKIFGYYISDEYFNNDFINELKTNLPEDFGCIKFSNYYNFKQVNGVLVYVYKKKQ